MIKKPCTLCSLSRFRRTIVRARYSGTPAILFLGEAPGRSEDLIGEAFVGPAGKVLGFLMEDAGIVDDYYIMNCCACRPCDSKSHPNREPAPHEILACMPRVHAEIQKANPEKIVLLGNIAAKYYGREYPDALKLIHPSYLLRTGGRASPYYTAALRALEDYNGKKI